MLRGLNQKVWCRGLMSHGSGTGMTKKVDVEGLA